MIKTLRVVALVPARGGSKSVPYKNLYPLGGRPLIAWPIETARNCPEIDRVIVSTDDERIAAAAEELGAEIHWRPAELSGDSALVIDTIRHLRDELIRAGDQADIMVLLEATSPFRTPAMIARCLQRMVDEELDSIATFHAASINPERTWKIANGRPAPFIDGAIPWKPRQSLSPAYQLNGAVYAFRPAHIPEDSPSILFGQMGAEIVPAEEVIDIDDYRDFAIANAILSTTNRS